MMRALCLAAVVLSVGEKKCGLVDEVLYQRFAWVERTQGMFDEGQLAAPCVARTGRSWPLSCFARH